MGLCWQSNISAFEYAIEIGHNFLPRSKRLLISWLQSPSAVILEPPKIKSDTVSTVSPSCILMSGYLLFGVVFVDYSLEIDLLYPTR